MDLNWPLGLQKIEVPRMSWHLGHEGSKVVSTTHWLPLLSRVILGTHFCQTLS